MPTDGDCRDREKEAPMRISVVVPTYNAPARLQATIHSILAQTASPHEIIIVDDGSTDDTNRVCAAFGDAIIYLPITNGGQQRARNIGVERATGEWIAFLDHDDLWYRDYLAEVTAFRHQHVFDVVFCNSVTVKEEATGPVVINGNRFIEFSPTDYWQSMQVDPAARWSVLERYGYAKYLAFHPAQPSVMTIRKDLFQRFGGYDDQMRGSSAENFEFEIRALPSVRVGLIWRPLVTITRHDANASVDGSKMAMDLVNCLRFIQEHHDIGTAERNAVATELQQRLPDAIDGAFNLRRFPELCDYRAMLAAPPDLKMRVKCGIARLPRFIAAICADALSK
ncbi:MAG TPA: glycosyltransferase [Acetobacteraceae bacterium]|nr:glycosyltransferase [Acetobacteraceae bacterium]